MRTHADRTEDLVERLDFRDRAPEVIDLSPEGGVVKMLKESMIDCVVSDKVGSQSRESRCMQLN
jgi:ATP-dependent RNA helicase DDX24/MAK5